MANPDTLRDLQARLATQLEAAQTADRGPAWLAVEAGSCGLLLPLAEAGEIFPQAGCTAVPHTVAWFLGVTNLRGQLHGVVDLAAFLGLAAAPAPADGGWLVALNPRLDTHTALRVDRLAGLRRGDQLAPSTAPDGAPDRPRFAGARFHDAAGRAWQEIVLAELAGDPHFLDIVARA